MRWLLKKSHLIGISMILGFALAISLPIIEIFLQPLPVSSTSNTLLINKFMSAKAVTKELQNHKLINNSSALWWMIRLNGLSKKLKAGIYQINAGETAWHLVRRVVNGDILIQHIRIAEGSNQWQIKAQLTQVPYLNFSDNDWLSAAAGEGLLLADTYAIEAGSSSQALLKTARSNLNKVLDDLWRNRAPGLPYKNSYELLIAASIIEKEAALANERHLISGVIVNRIQSHMPLQMDPTVIYALGESYTGRLQHADLKVDSPYNSYRYKGLPPTPIAMVGRSALEAAAHPIFSSFLYFVAQGDGSHKFSATYAEQRQAIQKLRTSV